MLQGNVFHGFEEGPIVFNPTYKHSLNSCEYTYSLEDKKNPRIPSWTDRILYNCIKALLKICRFKSQDKNGIKQMDYNSMLSPFSSDHRAVYSHFIVTLNKKIFY